MRFSSGNCIDVFIISASRALRYQRHFAAFRLKYAASMRSSDLAQDCTVHRSSRRADSSIEILRSTSNDECKGERGGQLKAPEQAPEKKALYRSD